MSNYARPGAESRHNLIYWRYGDYLGIGPGAHGRLTIDGQRYATEHYKMPTAWLERAQNAKGQKLRQSLTGIEQANEYLIMGLRISEGISLSRVQNLADTQIDQHALTSMIDLGFVECSGDNLRTTPRGRLLLNSVIAELGFS